MTHLIIHVADVPDSDDVEHSVICDRGNNCRVWYDCAQPHPDHKLDSQDLLDVGEFDAHGEDHQLVEGRWMTNTGRCAVDESDSARDYARFIAEDIPAGSAIEADVDYQGDGDWWVGAINGTTRPATDDELALIALPEPV